MKTPLGGHIFVSYIGEGGTYAKTFRVNCMGWSVSFSTSVQKPYPANNLRNDKE